MKVKFNNFDRVYLKYKKEFDEAYRNVMLSGMYIGGNQVNSFEKEFATYCGAKQCVGVGNGLDAIYLSLRALGVGSGDEVIVPANTYIATWLAISRTGATIVPVEPDLLTYNINPSLISQKITERTKVILPVDLYGRPCEIDDIKKLKESYQDISIVIDAAQSHGATYKGKKVGSLADITAFSFYPTKNLGAFGDAGCITTDDPEIAERVQSLRNYGEISKYNNKYLGVNSRLDELQAAMLRVKLTHLAETNSIRSDIARFYMNNLSDKIVELPAIRDHISPAWYVFPIRSLHRDLIKNSLYTKSIDSIVHYPVPPHLQTAYSYLGFKKGDFPITERIANEILSLPTDPFLFQDELEYLVKSINEVNV